MIYLFEDNKDSNTAKLFKGDKCLWEELKILQCLKIQKDR